MPVPIISRRALLAAPLLAAPLLAPVMPALAARRVPLAAIPIDRLYLRWWKARFYAKQAELRRGPADLLWLGDSITQDWELHGPEAWRDFAPVWQRFYGGRHAVNLGFIGDCTSHLLWRIMHGEVEGIRPKAAVVLIGANNFGATHWGAADTVQGIDAILAVLRARQPQMQVLLLGVLPSIRNAWISEQTALTNRALAARDWSGTHVTYMDVGGIFMSGGRVDASRFLDPHLHPADPPLHPTAQSQARIAEAIEPTLARMLGDRSRVG
ncbi:MAG: GDSL-type esterase/lipase family protein [Acetobacteraceae bacterium]